MAQVSVCVGDDFRISGGVLDIQDYAGRRLVLNASPSVSNDGSFTTQSVLPGLNHIDTTQSWTNTTVTDQIARVEIIPSFRRIKASEPNQVFFRSRATFAVGSSPTAADPDLIAFTDEVSEFGGGFDLHADAGATPAAGVWLRNQAPMPWAYDDILVPAGQTLQIKYRVAHYSPDPFATNANNNSAQYDATATGALIQVWAAPVGVST